MITELAETTRQNFTNATVPQFWVDEYIAYTRQEFSNGCLSMAMAQNSPRGTVGVEVTFLDRSFTHAEFTELALTCEVFTLISELPDTESLRDGCRYLSNKEITDTELEYQIGCAFTALKARRVEN